MRRMDRLIAIVIALQQRNASAQMLADQLEVSKRTIMRDMQTLAEIGVPVYAEAGAAGGYRLAESYRLPPLQLDVQEVLTVLVALQALTAYADTPFNEERWTVMDKLRDILPSEALKQVEPLLDVMHVEVPKRSYKAPLLNELLDYCARAEWMNGLYRSEKHHRWLVLHPRKVYAEHGFWYCEAYSSLHGEVRIFRADRFEELQPAQAQDYPPKADTTLQAARNSQTTIRIKALLTYRGMLLVEQDPHFGENVQLVGEEQWEVEFDCPESDWSWAIRFFFGLGIDAHVVTPDALRTEIFNLSQQLCERYQVRLDNK